MQKLTREAEIQKVRLNSVPSPFPVNRGLLDREDLENRRDYWFRIEGNKPYGQKEQRDLSWKDTTKEFTSVAIDDVDYHEHKREFERQYKKGYTGAGGGGGGKDSNTTDTARTVTATSSMTTPTTAVNNNNIQLGKQGTYA